MGSPALILSKKKGIREAMGKGGNETQTPMNVKKMLTTK